MIGKVHLPTMQVYSLDGDWQLRQKNENQRVGLHMRF
jgi:hypothetical protein